VSAARAAIDGMSDDIRTIMEEERVEKVARVIEMEANRAQVRGTLRLTLQIPPKD
jgi:hypothetical protein